MSLTQDLEAFVKEARTRIPPAMLEVMDKATEELANSGILERTIKVGDKAPEFTLSNATGKEVSLSRLLSRGPLVMSFYRGVW